MARKTSSEQWPINNDGIQVKESKGKGGNVYSTSVGEKNIVSLTWQTDKNGAYRVSLDFSGEDYAYIDWLEVSKKSEEPFGNAFRAVMDKLFSEIEKTQPKWLHRGIESSGIFSKEGDEFAYRYVTDGNKHNCNTSIKVLGYELLKVGEKFIPVAILDVIAISKTNDWGPERSLIAVSLAGKVQISKKQEVIQFPVILAEKNVWRDWYSHVNEDSIQYLEDYYSAKSSSIGSARNIRNNRAFGTSVQISPASENVRLHIANRVAGLLRSSYLVPPDKDFDNTSYSPYKD